MSKSGNCPQPKITNFIKKKPSTSEEDNNPIEDQVFELRKRKNMSSDENREAKSLKSTVDEKKLSNSTDKQSDDEDSDSDNKSNDENIVAGSDNHSGAETDESNEVRHYKKESKADNSSSPSELESPEFNRNDDSNDENQDVVQSQFSRKAGTSFRDLPQVSKNNYCDLPDLELSAHGNDHHLLGNPAKGRGYKWNNDFVRMPCDDENKIMTLSPKGEKLFLKRWDTIKKAFEHPITDVYKLQEAILMYNSHRTQVWSFECLKAYFQESRFKMEKRTFFKDILPEIIKLALEMQIYFDDESIPMLKQDTDQMITITQDQAACLLANAFLCTFPWRSKDKKHSRLPSINFNSLFNSPSNEVRHEKIKCIIHYFDRVTKRNSSSKGRISYRRQVMHTKPDWFSTKKSFTRLHVSADGTIEDNGKGMLQADFANKYVGGGVIGHGCVQEEIRFLICPEMIVSRLFTEVFNDNEVLIMTGCERYSDYKGYAKTFQWTGNHQDNVERDKWHRRYTEVVAMDAAYFPERSPKHEQFSVANVERELNKAYCAFFCPDKYAEEIPTVCTGNWGCGAFGGDKELKGLIQLIAASHADRDVCFFTFQDERFGKDFSFVHSKIKEHGYDTVDIVTRIKEYYVKGQYRHKTLFVAMKDIL